MGQARLRTSITQNVLITPYRSWIKLLYHTSLLSCNMHRFGPIVPTIQFLISNHPVCWASSTASAVSLSRRRTQGYHNRYSLQQLHLHLQASRPNGAGFNPVRALTCATSASLPDMHCAPVPTALFGLGPAADDITKTNRRAKL